MAELGEQNMVMDVLTVGDLNEDILKNLVRCLYSKHLDFLKTLDETKAVQMLILDMAATCGLQKTYEIWEGANLAEDSKEVVDLCNEFADKYINTVSVIGNGKSVKLCSVPQFDGESKALSLLDFEKYDKDTIICDEYNLPIRTNRDGRRLCLML